MPLEGLKEYHQRYKVCEEHLKIPCIVRDGQQVGAAVSGVWVGGWVAGWAAELCWAGQVAGTTTWGRHTVHQGQLCAT